MLSVLVHFSESKLFHNCSVAYCKICFFIGMHFDLKLQVINSVVQGFFVGSEIYPWLWRAKIAISFDVNKWYKAILYCGTVMEDWETESRERRISRWKIVHHRSYAAATHWYQSCVCVIMINILTFMPLFMCPCPVIGGIKHCCNPSFFLSVPYIWL